MTLRPILFTLALVGVTLAASASRAAALDPKSLDRSLDLLREYLLNAQHPDGGFVYEFDAARGADMRTRHAVREISGLWGLSLLHRRHPTPETAAAIVKSLKFYDKYAKRTPAGGRYFCEPGAREWTTNYLGLHVLALSEFLGADHEIDPELRKKLETDLADEVKFLVSLRLSGGRFPGTYRCADGRGASAPTPYADGEALLALVRVAKETGDESLRDACLTSAATMYAEYVRLALRADPDSKDAHGFYQWGSMAFYELYTSGWPGTQPYAQRTIAMARWMIDHQQILTKNANVAHAFEGLAVAWELARLTNDTKNQRHIGAALTTGLSKLMQWQIGSPSASSTAVPPAFGKSPKARGGVVMAPGLATVRIDTVLHQTNATMLVRLFFFRPDEAAADGQKESAPAVR